MRIATFLLGLSFVAVLLVAESSSSRRASTPSPLVTPLQQREPDSLNDGVRMWRRAEIRVLPIDLVVANRQELESLRQRAAHAETQSGRGLADPVIRQQLAEQDQIIRALLRYAERQESDAGKSATAVRVQRHLNYIEGRTTCEACHPNVVAGAGAIRRVR